MARKTKSRKTSKKACAIATKTVTLKGRQYNVRIYKRKGGSYVANIVSKVRKKC